MAKKVGMETKSSRHDAWASFVPGHTPDVHKMLQILLPQPAAEELEQRT